MQPFSYYPYPPQTGYSYPQPGVQNNPLVGYSIPQNSPMMNMGYPYQMPMQYYPQQQLPPQIMPVIQPIIQQPVYPPYNNLGTGGNYFDHQRKDLNFGPDGQRNLQKPLNVEEEYNWAVHISDILDEFINRDRHTRHDRDYQKLQTNVKTSLARFKTTPVVTDDLLPPVRPNESVGVEKEQKLAVDLNPPIRQEVSPINNVIANPGLPESVIANDTAINKEISSEINKEIIKENLAVDSKNNFNFLDLSDIESDFNIQDNDNLITNPDFLTDISDFTNSNELSEFETDFIDLSGLQGQVLDSAPAQPTYQDYELKTALGKISASEIYQKMFDEYGEQKISQFDVMETFGITEKQYNKLIDNFYNIGKAAKKISADDVEYVNTSHKTKKRIALYVFLGILGAIILLCAIAVILYFTVPSVHDLFEGWFKTIFK
ncbi:hypothetical protein SSYRP_v1c01960 [Spiroplasma syrphidicola EA-1]|uniref:Transmembrane protein n=2 Tax=Spiroplasma syrphidicola TaxID=216945 RepID=R4U330_9MOLU|nr:hypothetical protein SSYRP_v1c01960 [Spiroplasma syrphidicola EA-1]